MAATTHERARLRAGLHAGLSERSISIRRLLLAALASVLVHLLLWGGLSATRLSMLGGKPQDATTPKPVTPPLKPKIATDFPLIVSKAPAATPAHERRLDMQAAPVRAPDLLRPTPDRRPQQQTAPDQSVPFAVPQPILERIASPRERLAVTAPPTAVDRQPLSMASEPAPAVADMAKIAPAADGKPVAPKPAATQPRPNQPEPATVGRRQPREVALAPAMPPSDLPPLSPRSLAASRVEPEPAPARAPAAAARRAPAAAVDAPPLAVAPIAQAIGEPGAAGAALEPRPRSEGLTAVATRADRGDSSALRRPMTSRDPAADAAAEMPSARTDPIASVVGRGTAAPLSRPGGGLESGDAASTATLATADTSATVGNAAPTPLVRSTPAGSNAASAADGSVAAVAMPAVSQAGGGTGPPASDLATGLPAPAAMSRLGNRPAGLARAPAAAPIAMTIGADRADRGSLEEVVEGLSTSSEVESKSVTEMLAGRSRGTDLSPAAVLMPQPLSRVAAVTLPVEGRLREIAIPFARRSRTSRDTRDRDQAESDLMVREKTRVLADAMVDRGLEFLARAQQPDGRWRLGAFPGATAADTPKLNCDTAATGLAILSFLGAGHDHFDGKHRDTVRRGLEFLLSVQKPDGDLYVPSDKLSDSCAWLYSHGIASMALCEAVGMTGDPLVKSAAARACDFITASQHPSRGGWRYTPRSDADLSVSGWMLVALRSGRLAGVAVEPESFAGVKTLLDASALPGDPAKYHYNPRNPQQRPSTLSAGCMTAVGTLMRLHTGWNSSDPRVRQSAQALAALRPAYGTVTEKTRDCYLWYYASQVLVHTGGEEWTDWYDTLANTLEATQERQGPKAGSWDPLGTVPDRWGPYGGRIYVTTLHLLSLEVPDRRLPTYGSPDDMPAQ